MPFKAYQSPQVPCFPDGRTDSLVALRLKDNSHLTNVCVAKVTSPYGQISVALLPSTMAYHVLRAKCENYPLLWYQDYCCGHTGPARWLQ